MKQLAITITTSFWVPEDRYEAAGSLSLLAQHIRDAVEKPLNEWASQPEFAKGNTVVSVEAKE